MATSSITLDTKQVKITLSRIIKALPELEAEAVWKESEVIWKASQRRVPEKMGALRRSGRRTVYRKGDAVNVLMEYGRAGSSAPYAYAIHEHPINTEASPYTWFKGRKKGERVGGVAINLKYTKGGSGNQYLKGPVDARRHSFPKGVARRIKFQLQQLAATKGAG